MVTREINVSKKFLKFNIKLALFTIFIIIVDSIYSSLRNIMPIEMFTSLLRLYFIIAIYI